MPEVPPPPSRRSVAYPMLRSVEQNAALILSTLAAMPRADAGRTQASGKELEENTGLTPGEINDAVTILVEGGLAEWHRHLGTHPYEFGSVGITPRGRHEYERMSASTVTEPVSVPTVPRSLQPAGSPYGFSEEDWEIVEERRARADELYVALGHQFCSEHFESVLLQKNIEAMFERAVAGYNQNPSVIAARLVFRSLAAGYGEHLFNEIARDIISSDIAVFETSDLNPNVMLELGVALTWGVRVLPIKTESCPKPPSDISGHTWADYRSNAAEFVDPEHDSKLLRMVKRALRKKLKS